MEFGTTLRGMLNNVEGKTKEAIERKQQQLLNLVLGIMQPKGRYADPAAMLRAQGNLPPGEK